MIISHLKRMMTLRGISTQKDLAKKSGVPENTVSRFGRMGQGRMYSRLDTYTLERLCKAFNCQPGDLLEYVPDDSAA